MGSHVRTDCRDAGHDRELFVAESGKAIVGYARAVRVDRPLDVAGVMPVGWFLLGVVVDAAFRGMGVGTKLTVARIEWLCDRTEQVYYFTAVDNVASQSMHAVLGFERLPLRVRLNASADSATEQALYVLELPRARRP